MLVCLYMGTAHDLGVTFREGEADLKSLLDFVSMSTYNIHRYDKIRQIPLNVSECFLELNVSEEFSRD